MHISRKLQNFFLNYSNYTSVLLFVAILFLGLFLRHVNYRTIPRHGATFDEFAWTWLGVNLIEKHTPISWSSQPQYTNRYHLVYQGARFWIVTPYLEHPPLFGLIAGGFSLLNGVHSMYDVTLPKIRPFALLLGALSMCMVFIFTRQNYGPYTAFLATFIYAITPTLTIGSRIVQNENFLIPMWLLALYFTGKYLKSGKKRFRNIAAVIAGLLSLAKVPWLIVGFSLAMVLSFKGRWKDAVFIGLVTLGIFCLFLLYGFYFGRDLFIKLWQLQVARYDISFAGFFSIFTNPLLVDRYYLDGWILFGWFSIFAISREIKKHYMVLIPFVAYFVLYIFAIPNEPSHGWYRYPFYPFLIIASGVMLGQEIKKITLVSLFFLFIVGLSLLSNFWEPFFGFSFPVYRIFIVLSCVSVLVPLWFSKYGKMGKIFLYFWLFSFSVLSICSIVNYIE